MARVDEKDFKVMGKSFPRKEGPDMATGRFKHVGDYQLPGMLWGSYLCSPYAHANIKSIDTSKAKALPGVRAVLTDEDIGPIYMTKISSHNMRPLAEKARAVGDAIVAVAADTLEIAEEALELIDVEYEVLAHVVDPREAMLPGAPEIHAHGHGQSIQPGNIRVEVDRDRYGSLEAGIAAADKTYEFNGFISPGCSNHNSELRCTLVHWPREDRMEVWTTTQGVFEDLMNLGRDLEEWHKLPVSKMRVMCECAGGGFGSNKFGRNGYIATLLSIATGKRPVRVEHSRRLELGFEAHGRSQNFTQSLKVGVKNNGDLTFADWHTITLQGAYSQDTTSLSGNWTTQKVDNNHERIQNIYTNTAKGGWKRGVSGPICVWPQAVALDEIAEDLGITPWDYAFQTMGDDYDHGREDKRPWISNLVREGLTRTLAASDFKAKWKGWSTPVAVNGSKKRGIGLAISRQPCGNAGGNCLATLRRDGNIYGEWGTTNTGQGSPTTQSQVLAEATGVTYDTIIPFVGDTNLPQNPRSAASVITLSTSPATIKAGTMLKEKILGYAAPVMEVETAEELDMEESVIWVKADPTKTMTLKEMIPEIPRTPDYSPYGNFPVVVGYGSTGPVPDVSAASWGAYVFEVDVDIDTGLVDVVNAWSSQDCGRPLNPMVVQAQSEGGIVEGIDMALYEDRLWDPQSGVCLSTDWLTYLLPTFLDMPQGRANILLFDKPDDPNCPLGPYGAKGFAEGASQAVHPAISNAIYNAIGARMHHAPMTPDKILTALGKG